MKILDNINHTVREDLQDTMQKGSRVSIAAACFSIYAYQELKKQLEEIAELRFIFTSPTFVQENTPKERREFYIPKLTREKSLYGTEFEVRLRNELTQKALAKECADWVRRKVKFRSNVSGEQMPGFMTVGESFYMPISGFTTVDLGCERGNNAYYPVQRTEAFENGRYFLLLFDEIWNDSSRLQDVTDIVLQSISTAYRENSPDFISLPSTIFSVNFWRMCQKIISQMKLRASSRVKSGICSMIFSEMQRWPLSTSWNSITAAFLQTAWALARRSLHWL